MSAQASAANCRAARADPAAIRAELPEELRGQFDAEYQAVLEEARVSYRLGPLNEVVEAWWKLVSARRSPRYEDRPRT
jgi:hypothetical protein